MTVPGIQGPEHSGAADGMFEECRSFSGFGPLESNLGFVDFVKWPGATLILLFLCPTSFTRPWAKHVADSCALKSSFPQKTFGTQGSQGRSASFTSFGRMTAFNVCELEG